MTDRHLVLFDIDGTLLHSGGCGRAATELALHDVFGTAGVLEHVNFAGKTDWGILREALSPAGFTSEQIDAQLATHNHTVGERLAEIVGEFPVQACEGAAELIAALRAHPLVTIGIVTGNMEALVPIKLRAAGFDPSHFSIGAFGSEGWERAMLPPLALERARVHTQGDFAAERIVIIGDTPDDITCADSIGARTIAVATGPFSADQLRVHNPDYVFDTMRDHEAILDAILNNGHAAG